MRAIKARKRSNMSHGATLRMKSHSIAGGSSLGQATPQVSSLLAPAEHVSALQKMRSLKREQLCSQKEESSQPMQSQPDSVLSNSSKYMTNLLGDQIRKHLPNMQSQLQITQPDRSTTRTFKTRTDTMTI